MTRIHTATTAAAAMAAALGLAVFAGAANAAAHSGITADKVTEMKKAWGEGIVHIGKVYTDGGDYEAAAREHIETFYAYGESDVLFKPTLAAEDQFRGTFDEALSYFVKGSIAEDNGFAIAPYTDVRWENEGTVIDAEGEGAMAMGNYFFTTTDGSEVKVEYTFGFDTMPDGDLKIVLHHSSLPYAPS